MHLNLNQGDNHKYQRRWFGKPDLRANAMGKPAAPQTTRAQVEAVIKKLDYRCCLTCRLLQGKKCAKDGAIYTAISRHFWEALFGSQPVSALEFQCPYWEKR